MENEPTYALLAKTLNRIANGRDPEIATRLFEIELLGLLDSAHSFVNASIATERLGPSGTHSALLVGALCVWTAAGRIRRLSV